MYVCVLCVFFTLNRSFYLSTSSTPPCVCVCVVFTLNRSFYPTTAASTPSVRADSSS
eukprot:TRINITY_DN1811_c0_g1_i1.p1 TRINITY_DN1811_c0_g1~~TRINITY_DN1811_c0_g1_i1.p1  ORF type:complete len:57 (-),score=5.00 TRINITY_DN1811_c0_g1_i1:59-229(-)